MIRIIEDSHLVENDTLFDDEDFNEIHEIIVNNSDLKLVNIDTKTIQIFYRNKFILEIRISDNQDNSKYVIEGYQDDLYVENSIEGLVSKTKELLKSFLN